ncbi:MAG: enoyl-CoA hydratase/isomerase family protein [Gammaproteobacteria bacterium]|nr:enoyl-CoA hydratase/isomerase family protein [Gammaproteobacteria bacterium]
MTDSLIVEVSAGIAACTLNRPARLNALDRELRDAIIAALARAAEDPAVRVVTFTGAGERAFCAGQDLNESATLGDAGEGDWIGSWRRFFAAFLDFPKPMIASLNGVTAGGGLEIAMMCDIRLAVPEARLIVAEIDVGLPTILGGHWLAALVFDSRALEMVLTGRSVMADEARNIGLVHEVVPGAELAARTRALAAGLAAKPSRAMALNVRRFRELRRAAMERDGVYEALVEYQREAVASGEPGRVMQEFLAARARRRST